MKSPLNHQCVVQFLDTGAWHGRSAQSLAPKGLRSCDEAMNTRATHAALMVSKKGGLLEICGHGIWVLAILETISWIRMDSEQILFHLHFHSEIVDIHQRKRCLSEHVWHPFDG